MTMKREVAVSRCRFFRRGLLVLLLMLVGLAVVLAGLTRVARSEAQALTLPSMTLPTLFNLQNPQVLNTSPDRGQTDVPYDPVIYATFDRTMDPSTMSWASFYLTKLDNTLVTSTLKYSTDGLGWYLYPLDPLQPGTTYVAHLTAAAKGTNGFVLWGTPINWSFTTIYFTDVSLDNPYAVAISRLGSASVLSGFADGSFRPGEPVKRMQFAKMISRTIGLQPTVNDVCPFGDVPGNLDANDPLYPDHYVAAAFAYGVTQGKTATSFAPYDPITRYQLISMVVRALQKGAPAYLQTPPADYHSSWDATLSPEHGQNARIAEYNHLLKGIPLASLNPWEPIPRGEVAQVLDNIGG
jgi:hypothetical protein